MSFIFTVTPTEVEGFLNVHNKLGKTDSPQFQEDHQILASSLRDCIFRMKPSNHPCRSRKYCFKCFRKTFIVIHGGLLKCEIRARRWDTSTENIPGVQKRFYIRGGILAPQKAQRGFITRAYKIMKKRSLDDIGLMLAEFFLQYIRPNEQRLV